MLNDSHADLADYADVNKMFVFNLFVYIFFKL